ncbi:light-inducible protein CPRF2 isoform X2 [Manihot esculenta]|uniref:Uncharacterized protein n=1 Tax=Manihot esculenta TaxID=3983 RepID=A0ACB7HAM9_MANES|nr:light-inducible protein CPRF2 isoform X2 [Manihot esculenta]KAG8649753.1 hypothetical protein MANES_08G134500v8 [Manihot esculenta]
MDRVFSVGEISDQFWSLPPPPPPPAQTDDSSKMNRSESEWAFQRFLQEASVVPVSASASDSSPQSSSAPAGDKSDVVEMKDNDKTTASSSFTNGRCTTPFNVAAALGAPPNTAVGSEEYQAFLKSKLNLACAAVALSRAPFLKPQDSPARADSGSQASNASQLGSHAAPKEAGSDLPWSQDMDANGPVGIASLPSTQKKFGATLKPTTSGSSREQSEDDENEGETEITKDMDPTDAKRARRMLSNRESARRSRRRKQAHLTDLETQVKMAEETVKRITGLNPLIHALPEISTISMSSFDGSPSDTSTDAAVPVNEDPNHHFYQPPNNPMSVHESRVNNALADISSVENLQPHSGAAGLAGNMKGRTASLQRVASLEHLQKQIRRGITPGPQSNGEQI